MVSPIRLNVNCFTVTYKRVCSDLACIFYEFFDTGITLVRVLFWKLTFRKKCNDDRRIDISYLVLKLFIPGNWLVFCVFCRRLMDRRTVDTKQAAWSSHINRKPLCINYLYVQQSQNIILILSCLFIDISWSFAYVSWSVW